MAVSTAFPPACYKSDAFLLNRETIPLQMELIPAKIGMELDVWNGCNAKKIRPCVSTRTDFFTAVSTYSST